MTSLLPLHLQVVGDQTIHCGGCENAIQFVLCNLAGVQTVGANHRTQTIDVVYDDEKTNRTQIEEELEGLGYQVQEVQP